MRVADGVHHFPTGPFNWYLIEAGGRLTVVDAGFPGHYPALLDGLASLGRGVTDVEAVVLTHAHADHTGFAERLRREAGCPVFVHRDDLPGVRRSLNLPWYGLLSNAWRGYVRRLLLHATGNGIFFRPGVRAAQAVGGGDVLDVPGRPVVLHLPGHTPGQAAFFLPDRGVLFSGDTLVTLDLMTGRGGDPQVPHRLLNADDRQSRASLAKLKELGRVTLLPGHGRPWVGTAEEAIDRARGNDPTTA